MAGVNGVFEGADFQSWPGRAGAGRSSATQYNAPWQISIGASYVIQAGGYVGPLVTRIAAADPRFGPGTVTLANGTTQPNPLAATIRFCGATALPCLANPTRSETDT